MGRLDGKIAIVTGGASGIGQESSILFAREGAKVVITDVNESSGETLADRINSGGIGECKFFKCDVSKEAEVAALVKFAEDTYGGLHIIFNNAGIMHPDDGDIMETTDKIWDLTMDINVKGVWYGCKHAIPAMKRSGGGSVINTASFVASLGAATSQSAYTASKGAVLAMSREIAVCYAREGIRVNTISPGPLQTPLLMEFLNTEEKQQRRLVHNPMGRFGFAREIAYTALFLASNEASYVTGADYKVDGGVGCAYVTPEGAPNAPPVPELL
eukprot:Clim_evm21s39 gene=Clim_evmTU21s39